MRILLLVLALSCTLAAQAPVPAVKNATADNLRFMSGDWVGELEGEQMEEFWSEPVQSNMACMFRSLKDGKPVFYEFIVIEPSSAGPVMKLKHFHAGLIGWEEKDFVWEYPLVKLAAGEAVFERPDKKTRLIYRRVAPDALVAVLAREGKPDEKFRYRLKK